MKILITAGNTQTPIDQVRCITNIFTGRTGAHIADHAAARGHTVVILTSHPETLTHPAVRVQPYRTFDDLASAMAAHIPGGDFDAIIHAAAISDYQVVGVYTAAVGRLVSAQAGKIKSHHPELWMQLTPTPKLVDQIRTAWQFPGVLVKFKLEVGLSETELLTIAEQSRLQSGADLMCANHFEERHAWAYVGAGTDYERVSRAALPATLLDRVEQLARLRQP